MINFIIGKPGGGKSLLAMRLLVDELTHGTRYVVTNLAIKTEALAEYLHKQGVACDIAARLRILNEDEVGNFWLVEGPNRECRTRRVFMQGDEKMDVPDFGNRQMTTPGVLYVIDEVHVYFDARRWMKVSGDARFFLSQHRKLGCDVLLVTQHPDQVDKGFRLLAQDYTVVRNFGNETIMGFTWKGVFRWATFQNIPHAGTKQPTSVTGTFKLDVEGIASLYDTSAGVGVLGRQSAKETRSKGRSPWWLIPIAAGCLAAIWYLPRVFNSALSAGVQATLKGSEESVAKAMGRTNAFATLPPEQHQTTVPQQLATTQGATAGPTQYVTMVMITPKVSQWKLSDGTIVTSRTPGFMAGDEDGVYYNGHYYPRSSPERQYTPTISQTNYDSREVRKAPLGSPLPERSVSDSGAGTGMAKDTDR